MAQMSNYLESGLLNYLFRSNTNAWAKPPIVALALCSGVPDDASVGNNLPEVPNVGGYARKDLFAPANGTWTEISQQFGAQSSGMIDNVSTITFPTATADWGWVSGIAIVDSGTYATGNVLMWGKLFSAREVKTNDTVSFSASALKIYFG
jgi:hypothetical protein